MESVADEEQGLNPGGPAVAAGAAAGLSRDDAQTRLRIFMEVAHVRDESSAVAVLSSCGWNVEQAVNILLGGESFGGAEAAPATAPLTGGRGFGDMGGAGGAGLGAPLLQPTAGTARSFQHSAASAAVAVAAPIGFRQWLRQGLRRLGDLVVEFVRSFIMGGAADAHGGGVARLPPCCCCCRPGAWFGAGADGGAVTWHGHGLRNALTSAYGTTGELQLPRFFNGAFPEALAAARSELKLLVVFLHSAGAPHSQEFCTNVLANEQVRTILDENFVLWAGDVASMQVRGVARLTNTREYPCLSVLLPASPDDTQLINSMSGQAELDMALALLTACLDEMQMHRSAIVARNEQMIEDRNLREAQDREYQEALEQDRLRAEAQALEEQKQREVEQLEEQKRQREREEAETLEAERLRREETLRSRGRELEEAGEGPEATSRISLRLPSGQRIDRRFAPDAALMAIYEWAEVAPFMPGHEGKGLAVPKRFVLKSSFPSRVLNERRRTISDLCLAGSNLLLAEIEDDDDMEFVD